MVLVNVKLSDRSLKLPLFRRHIHIRGSQRKLEFFQDINKFPQLQVVKTHFLLTNL